MTDAWWSGLGGLSHGSFFRSDGTGATTTTSDAPKLPGTAVPPPPATLRETLRSILTGSAFLYSPNATWFAMALCCWWVAPYDLEQQQQQQQQQEHQPPTGGFRPLDALLERLPVNLCFALAYIGFWHWVLYGHGICKRPFVPNRTYNARKVLHNALYTVLGIAQWTLVEGAFVHLWRTGGLPLPQEGTATTTTTTTAAGLVWTLLLSVAIPPYRDVHFYFCHRLIHLRCLYKYVHSLHHRTTDTEPFSGLAMHPVEHAYYYTCYGPILVLPALLPPRWAGAVHWPFLLFWTGFHAVLSPAASHSGYEDHFSADLAHYLHHRYGECNYSGGINFDACFGTHVGALRGGSGSPCPPPADPKASLGWLPEHPLYDLGACGLVASGPLLVSCSAVGPTVAALVATAGPAAWALALYVSTAPQGMPLRKACLAPFEKDPPWSLALHLGLGFCLGVLPAALLASLLLGAA